MCDCVPEREDDEAGDDEDSRKADEDVVAGVSPAGIVEHLCRLSERKEVSFTSQQSDCSASLHQLAVYHHDTFFLIGLTGTSFFKKKGSLHFYNCFFNNLNKMGEF